MTNTPDPRIEAVAKLLFTGPMKGFDLADWTDDEYPSVAVDRRECLMAAEDVLRGIDEAADWEYGIDWDDDAYPVRIGEPRAETETALAVMRERGDTDARLIRRRVASPWEPIT